MEWQIIPAQEAEKWRDVLSQFPKVDVCQLPEYHTAYSTRFSGANPVLFAFKKSQHWFCYPFVLTPVNDTCFFDISSTYGYSGPLATTEDSGFLQDAWRTFNDWARGQNVIAEFIRFSIYADNQKYAESSIAIEKNRLAAWTTLPDSAESVLSLLPAKTRNMISKAQKSGLVAEELDPGEKMAEFRKLYSETMQRNAAPGFFDYDDQYFSLLLQLAKGEIRLFGVYLAEILVAACIAIRHKNYALYHLGASRSEYSHLGGNNLCLYKMDCALADSGVTCLNLGGGRTLDPDDPLLQFKKRNATEFRDFYIGKRVFNQAAYQSLVTKWEDMNNTQVDKDKLIFYR